MRATKPSLHLNIVLAYIKLEKLENAWMSCNEELGLEGTSVGRGLEEAATAGGSTTGKAEEEGVLLSSIYQFAQNIPM